MTAAKSAPTTRCSFTASTLVLMTARLVAHDVDRVAGRQRLLRSRRRAPSTASATVHGVRARLLAQREEHRGHAVEQRRGLLVLLAVDHLADVAHADRVARLLPHDQVADLRRVASRARGCAPSARRARCRRGRPGSSGSASAMACCTSTTVTPAPRRRMGSSSTLICRLRPPMSCTCAHAVDRLERAADALVGELGRLAHRVALRSQREVEDGRRVRIELLHRRADRCPSGRFGRTVLTRSRTSCAATSTFFSMTNVTMTCETPSVVTERSSSMPLMVLTASSTLSVISVSTSSGAAPGCVVVTTTTGKSTLGKRSTPSCR